MDSPTGGHADDIFTIVWLKIIGNYIFKDKTMITYMRMAQEPPKYGLKPHITIYMQLYWYKCLSMYYILCIL